MDIEEVLQWTDEKFFIKTGKHLDFLQKSILLGTLQRQKYGEIAQNYHCSYAHVKKEAWKLWKMLSDVLGENVGQSNFKCIMENKDCSNVNTGLSEGVQINNISVCGHSWESPEISPKQELNLYKQSYHLSKNNKPHSTYPLKYFNLTEAPEIFNFYNRTSELTTLKQWILEKNRLITIYGLGGIGKSAIAVKLIEEINTEFDYIIWKSLNNRLSLSTLQTELKDFFSQSQQTPLPTIIDYFRNFRCLVILDDVQDIFKSGELAGQYLPGYENYGKFFKQVVTSSHQSCLILISLTKPREIVTLEADNQLIKILNLQGLGDAATEIFRKKGLTDEERWLELITLYQGHPSWLNIIASTIFEYFNGSVSLFLAEEEEIYLGDLEPLLESQLECLSESEKRVSDWLASQDESVNLSQRPVNLELSKSEFLQTIQSLGRRGLIEKVEGETRSLFTLNQIFKYYLKHKLS